jgi:hypothetical protein
MADKTQQPKPPKAVPAISGSDVAPVIFIDGAYAFGANSGILQIELGANALVPFDDQKVRTRLVCAAHLRGTPLAMLNLREAIDKALEMAAAATHLPGEAAAPKKPAQAN